MTDPVNAFQAQLKADLKTAMIRRNPDDVAALRALLAAIDNAQAVPGEEPGSGQAQRKFGDGSAEVPRRTIGINELNDLLESEIAMRRAAFEVYQAAGHPGRASQASREAEIIRRYVG